MKKIIIGLVAVAAVVAIGFAVVFQPKSNDTKNTGTQAGTGSEQTTNTTAEPNSVTISDYNFGPKILKVKKGTTVKWTNMDQAKHNVVVDDGQPEGGPDGPLIGKGENYEFTFNTVGTYNYHCDPHPYMKGTVEVSE